MPLAVLLLLVGDTLSRPAGSDHASRAAWSVQEAWQAWRADSLDAWRLQRLEPPDADYLQVVMELAPGLDPLDMAERLEVELPQAWVEEWAGPFPQGGAFIQAQVPYGVLPRLTSIEGVRWVREPHRPRHKEVMTEGYDAMFRQDWHGEGVTGRRVDVVVLDVGFTGYKDLLGSELPRSVEVSFRSRPEASRHGTAVAEIIHDIAPKARLTLATFGTDVEFLAALEEFSDGGAELVNGSIGFDNLWHADGQSAVTQAVDSLVTDAGVLYVAASGNENDRYRVGPLSPAGGGLVALDGLSELWVYSPGGWVDVSFRWSDPMGRSDNDLDLYVYDEHGQLCGRSLSSQDGRQDPFEAVTCQGGTNWSRVEVVLVEGSVEGLTGYLYSYYGLDEVDWSETMNLTLPGDTRAGLTVGAVDLPSWEEVAWYSSRGPTDDGRTKPELVAPANVITRSYGTFAGTSAATPHVTGVAALALHADRRHMTPHELKAWLVDNCLDIEDPGLDEISGAGFLSPDEIPWRRCGCAAARGGGLWPSFALLPLVLLGRRRVRP